MNNYAGKLLNSGFILIYENMLGRLSQFKPIVKNRRLMNIFYPLGFLLLSTLLEALYLNISEHTLRDIYLDHIADMSAQVINFITPNDKVFIHQNTLLSGKAHLEVARTCSGSSVLFFLVAAILVFSASVRHKIVGLVLAVILVDCYQPAQNYRLVFCDGLSTRLVFTHSYLYLSNPNHHFVLFVFRLVGLAGKGNSR